MVCWFIREEVVNFKPSERYKTGSVLIERWCKYDDIDPAEFICAHIGKLGLWDIHPITGQTQAGMQGNDAYPALESGLFPVSAIEAIEKNVLDRRAADRQAKNPGRFNHDPDFQAHANEIAKDLMAQGKRNVTRNEVAKRLAAERGPNVATVVRRGIVRLTGSDR